MSDSAGTLPPVSSSARITFATSQGKGGTLQTGNVMITRQMVTVCFKNVCVYTKADMIN
jgi:hypothetical protein